MKAAERWVGRHLNLNLKENERHWRALLEAGKTRLNESIEAVRSTAMEAWSEEVDDARSGEPSLTTTFTWHGRRLQKTMPPVLTGPSLVSKQR